MDIVVQLLFKIYKWVMLRLGSTLGLSVSLSEAVAKRAAYQTRKGLGPPGPRIRGPGGIKGHRMLAPRVSSSYGTQSLGITFVRLENRKTTHTLCSQTPRPLSCNLKFCRVPRSAYYTNSTPLREIRVQTNVASAREVTMHVQPQSASLMDTIKINTLTAFLRETGR